jgi:uncharacterized protein
MTRVTVHKLDLRGELVVRYDAELTERFADGVRLEASWTQAELPLGYTRFAPGDLFVEWFYTDRWYNIFEIHSAGGRLKGWYCNIAEPASIAAGVVASRDLLLDLWVNPQGEMQVLDEDEFAAAALDDATRARAQHSLAELKAAVQARQPPFHAIA